MSSSLDQLLRLDRQYAFYAGFHRNRINQLIHVICIPLIVISVLIFLSFVKLPVPIFQDGARFLTSFYAIYYIILDVQIGLSALPLVLSYHILAKLALSAIKSTPYIICFALLLQVIGWSAQLFGHFYFERRSPALTESVVQSFLVAPLFVFLEPILMSGYFPNLQQRLLPSSGENHSKTH